MQNDRNHNYDDDPGYYMAPNYRYQRSGAYYQTKRLALLTEKKSTESDACSDSVRAALRALSLNDAALRRRLFPVETPK